MKPIEFYGDCPVCGGQASCMGSFPEYEEYECDDCGSYFVVGYFVIEINEKEEKEED